MDVTNQFLKFRDTAKQVWNEVYMQVIKDNGGDFDIESNFCEVERKLFEILVLKYLAEEYGSVDFIGLHMSRPGNILANFFIVPAKNKMKAQVNRELHLGYWDNPLSEFYGGDAEINFVHFFDWDCLDCPRKYEFYIGRLKSYKNTNEFNGKDVIIPISEAKIIYIKNA